MATTRQVAEFYEVDVQAIYSLIHDNKEELMLDGFSKMKGKELISKLGTPSLKERVSITREQGGFLINGEQKISYSSVSLFPKRAILRVGMLLRDSEVVKNGHKKSTCTTQIGCFSDNRQ